MITIHSSADGKIQVLEMYHHKSGYAPNEQFALHARRRYRLMPPKYPNAALPIPDPALWITHYYSAAPSDRIPSNIIPTNDPRTQALFQTRMYLQSQGQIVQKEFMLHDRTNWPQIQFPQRQVRQPPYPISMQQTRTPQALAYPTHQMAAGNPGPPSKRPRTQTNASQAPSSTGTGPSVDIQDDEEDTSRGDLFDHMTPREVSLSRYKQNHEWMEEILSSPYPVSRIIPVDLGLGRRGELSSLTEGIFQAPVSVEQPRSGYVGRLDPAKADEFRNRCAERMVESIAEIERMKAKHLKRMAKFQMGSLIRQAEKALRTAVYDPVDTGPEYWRLEGKTDENEDIDGSNVKDRTQHKVDDIVAQVEATLGKHVVAVQELKRIQDGGLEESPTVSTPQPSRQASRNGSQQSGVLIDDGDLDMSGSAGGLLDQFRTGFSGTSTPGNSFPTPHAHLDVHSSNGTPALAHSPQHSAQNGTGQTAGEQQADKAMEDVDMQDDSKDDRKTPEWVVVPDGGVSPQTSAQPNQSSALEMDVVPATTSTSEQVSNMESVNDHLDLDTGLGDHFDSGDHNDFGSLEDLDTAGDALAGYGSSDVADHGGDLEGGLDLSIEMGLDDSAFGDAFRGVEPRSGDEGGDGL